MNNFPKGERLNNVKQIENLYAKGDKFMAYPFSVRFIYNKEQSEENTKMSVLLIAPKRYQKLAVNRNRAKRLLREAAINNIPVAIVGAKEEIIVKAIENLQNEINGIK